jgi:lipopolysaccharide biosynthesis glycosyltransferase
MNAVVLHCDSAYFNDYGYYCMVSIRHFNKDVKIYVNGMGFGKEEKEKVISLEDKNIELVLHDLKVPDNMTVPKYITQFKSEFIYQVMKHDHEKVLYVDSDSLVRGNLEKLWKITKEYDISMRCKGLDRKPIAKYTTSVVCIDNNKRMKNFVRDWKRKVEEDTTCFHIDQNTLGKMMEENKDVKYLPLARQFWDTGLRDNCIIWSPWGSGKDTEKFTKEKQKILKEFMVKEEK